MIEKRIVPTPPNGWGTWEELMTLALSEAKKAEEAGEIPVGAVIVAQDGKILGRGHNQCISTNDPSAHAEICAIRDACLGSSNYRLAEQKAVLAVTLEPCLMCTGAIVQARIAGLVYGAPDNKGGTVNSCLDGFDLYFHNHPVWHMGKVLENDCSAILQSFFSQKR